MSERTATIRRETSETRVELTLGLDGTGTSSIRTGIGALDHFLTLFARHGMFDLMLDVEGDLNVDAHHTVEDVGICLGQAILSALGERRGIRRAASAAIPMDESLAHVAVDCGGRSYYVQRGAFSAPAVGQLETDLVRHFFDSLARESRMNIHVLTLYGENAHHEVEALFKAFARALDAATTVDERLGDRLPSTKGHIEGSGI
ncbi:MAG TPA: imidazoleglycerol-phosphate dehydratase HisB [Thermomicrobiales bacterium]|nr:imidazoleglycerol-phosphate dehydratase HisB [Thermomicrobiales bacterium]